MPTEPLDKESAERDREFWQKYSKEPITRDDARKMSERIVSFFRLLARLDDKYKVTPSSQSKPIDSAGKL